MQNYPNIEKNVFESTGGKITSQEPHTQLLSCWLARVLSLKAFSEMAVPIVVRKFPFVLAAVFLGTFLQRSSCGDGFEDLQKSNLLEPEGGPDRNDLHGIWGVDLPANAMWGQVELTVLRHRRHSCQFAGILATNDFSRTSDFYLFL